MMSTAMDKLTRVELWPLERYAVSLADDGQLLVDKSRQFQEEMGQWKDPASYVPV